MIIDEQGVLPIVVFENGGEWPEVLKVAAPHLDKRGLGKFEQALGDSVKTVLVERHYIDKDYRDTFSNYHSKRFQTPDSRCNRLHFFNEIFDKAALVDVERMQRSYLGYSVVRPTRPNCVGRTLIYPVDSRMGEAHIRTCSEKIHLLGVSLEVHGFPFISLCGKLGQRRRTTPVSDLMISIVSSHPCRIKSISVRKDFEKPPNSRWQSLSMNLLLCRGRR